MKTHPPPHSFLYVFAPGELAARRSLGARFDLVTWRYCGRSLGFAFYNTTNMRIPPTPFLVCITLAQVCLTITVLGLLVAVGLSQSRHGELYGRYADEYVNEMTNKVDSAQMRHMGFTPDGIARKAHEQAQSNCRLIVTAQICASLLLALSGLGVLLAFDARKEAIMAGRTTL